MSNERIRELLADVQQVNADKLEYFRLYQTEREENARLRELLAKTERERDSARYAYSNAAAMTGPR